MDPAEQKRSLDQARRSHRAGNFDVAYQQLRAAREKAGLGSEDLDMLADAAWWLGLSSETVAITEELHRRFIGEGKVERAAMNALGLGFTWILRGEPAIGAGWLSRARRLLAPEPPGIPHGFLAYLDVSESLAGHDLEAAVAGAKDLQRLGTRLDSPTIVALGLLGEGLALVEQGEVRAGFDRIDEAMLPVIAGEVPPEWVGNIYCAIMSICDELADTPRARQWTEATERWCRGFSSAAMFVGICRAHRAGLLSLEGAWDSAEREALRARADLADLNVEVVAESEYQLGEIYRLRGQDVRAQQSYDRARASGRDPQPGAALLQLQAGDVAAASTSISGALADAGDEPFRRARLLRAHVEIALAAGKLSVAERSSRDLRLVCDTYRTPGFCAWADEAAGAVLLARGLAEEALPLLHGAFRRYRDLRHPYDQAQTRVLLASALHATGESDQADAETRLADESFRRLGVGLTARRAPRVRAVRPASLTEREVEVLTRIADGSSNRVVALALGISERTVGRHLANIYAKIGVRSRTAAAAWAFECGLIRPAAR